MKEFLQSTLFTNALDAVITCAVVSVATFAIGVLKQKLGVDKFNKYYDIAYRAVLEAEQIIQGSKAGKLRKEMVFNKVTEELGKFLTPDQIKSLIESAVGAMNLIKKQNSLPEYTTGESLSLDDVAEIFKGVTGLSVQEQPKNEGLPSDTANVDTKETSSESTV